MKNEIFGIDLFLPMLLILIKTFFITWPFISDEEYIDNFTNNFAEISEEVFDKLI